MRLDNVSFAYPSKPVLSGLTLELPEVPVCALAGPSGCGKTTLLRLLGGLIEPDSGTIDVPAPRDIAFLFQENRLLPRLPVSGQLAAVLPRGTDPLPWLEAVGLRDEARSPVSALSGGMRRRVALARCMAYGATKRLLLLDEPFTGVDPETARTIMASIRALHVPVVLSAHDAESLSLADCVIRFDGPPLKVV